MATITRADFDAEIKHHAEQTGLPEETVRDFAIIQAKMDGIEIVEEDIWSLLENL